MFRFFKPKLSEQEIHDRAFGVLGPLYVDRNIPWDELVDNYYLLFSKNSVAVSLDIEKAPKGTIYYVKLSDIELLDLLKSPAFRPPEPNMVPSLLFAASIDISKKVKAI